MPASVAMRATAAFAAATLGPLLVAAAVVALVLARPAPARGSFVFDSIDGGVLALDAWRGRPVLVVNTASLCGYTPQYAELQALHERYGPRGLVVLAVPSNDFRQELATAAAVREFCEVNFGLTLPMTEITRVRGPSAHPFYRWLAEAHGFRPSWNFNKVLIGPDGALVATWGAAARPTGPAITAAVERLLGR